MRKILYIFLFLVIVGLLWYLFIKPSDYTINFKANASVGTINQTLKLWNDNLSRTKSIEIIEDIKQGENLNHLTQRVKFGDSIHRYEWNIDSSSDSLTKVTVHIKDKQHSLMNKLKIPFSYTDFEKRSEKTVFDFMKHLKQHTDNFKVSIVGTADIPEKYLAYIPIKAKQFEKAGGMMRNFVYLTNELANNGAVLDGPPMIEVTYWNQENDSIHYNFGQPVLKAANLPTGGDIEYKRIYSKKAIKAIYNGNYITSDRAWYALLEYAEKNAISIEATPFEIFYNNPNVGADEINWKADVFLPIKTN